MEVFNLEKDTEEKDGVLYYKNKPFSGFGYLTDENGNKGEGNYVNGKRDGKWVDFDENGNIESKEYWCNGEK